MRRNRAPSQDPRRTQSPAIGEENVQVAPLIENFFCKFKEFERIAIRADKTDQGFAANIWHAAAVNHSR